MSPKALFNRTLGDILQKKSASLNFKVMDVYEEAGGDTVFPASHSGKGSILTILSQYCS